MSTTTKRMIGYSSLVWALLLLTAALPLFILHAHAMPTEALPAVANAEPTPWWQQVEQFQGLALKWIAALTAVSAALATLIGVVFTQYLNFRERINRVSDRVDTLQSTAVIATAVQAASNVDTAAKISSLQNQPSSKTP